MTLSNYFVTVALCWDLALGLMLMRVRQFINTFLTPKFLWKYVINYDSFFKRPSHSSKIWNSTISKICYRFWFLPEQHLAFLWRDEKYDGDNIYLEMDEDTLMAGG